MVYVRHVKVKFRHCLNCKGQAVHILFIREIHKSIAKIPAMFGFELEGLQFDICKIFKSKI